MKKYLLIAFLLLLSFAGCKDEDMNKAFMPFDKVSALKFFEGSTDYSEWYQLMLRSGIAQAYNFSTTEMTCFTVKNDVLLAYLSSHGGYNSIADVPEEVALKLVKYHTLPHKTYSLGTFREGKLADSTSTGDYLSCQILLDVAGGSEVLINRSCRLIKWNIEVVNGMVHELDQVMDPVLYNLYDFLGRDNKYLILKEAFERTATDTLLKVTMVPGLPLKSRRTLFVTSDSIFKADLNINNFKDLSDKIARGNTDYTNPENPLNQYMRYRVLEGDYTTKELAEMYEWKSLSSDQGAQTIVNKRTGFTLPTLAENKLILIKAETGGVNYVINDYSKPMKFVPERYNIQVRNGFVHEVDGLMEIYEPENILTVFEPTSFVNFQQIEVYRSKDSDKTPVNIIQKDYQSVVKWTSTPRDKKDAVAYVVWTKGSNHFGEGSGFRFLYADCLFLNLGPVGDVTVVTTPIPKGVYKIKIYYRVTKAVGGIFQPYLDPDQGKGDGKLGGEISAYDPEWDKQFMITMTDRIVFNETRPHTFKLKVTKPGELFWDLLMFEPVKE